MNGFIIIILAAVVLVSAYMIYGRYLVKKWGIDPDAVHGGKVLHCTKEHTADQNPKQCRKPAEYRSLNRAGNWGSAGNRRKLMAKDHICVCGHIVHPILFGVSGRLCIGINSPLFYQIATINHISTDQNHSLRQFCYWWLPL